MTDTIEQLELPLGLPPAPSPAQTADANRAIVTAELQRVREANQDSYNRVTAIKADGTRAVPDPGGILGVRLNTLLDMIFDPDSRDMFELRFETAMVEVLERCLAQRNAAELLVATAAAPPGSGLILPPR